MDHQFICSLSVVYQSLDNKVSMSFIFKQLSGQRNVNDGGGGDGGVDTGHDGSGGDFGACHQMTLFSLLMEDLFFLFASNS